MPSTLIRVRPRAPVRARATCTATRYAPRTPSGSWRAGSSSATAAARARTAAPGSTAMRSAARQPPPAAGRARRGGPGRGCCGACRRLSHQLARGLRVHVGRDGRRRPRPRGRARGCRAERSRAWGDPPRDRRARQRLSGGTAADVRNNPDAKWAREGARCEDHPAPEGGTPCGTPSRRTGPASATTCRVRSAATPHTPTSRAATSAAAAGATRSRRARRRARLAAAPPPRGCQAGSATSPSSATEASASLRGTTRTV